MIEVSIVVNYLFDQVQCLSSSNPIVLFDEWMNYLHLGICICATARFVNCLSSDPLKHATEIFSKIPTHSSLSHPCYGDRSSTIGWLDDDWKQRGRTEGISTETGYVHTLWRIRPVGLVLGWWLLFIVLGSFIGSCYLLYYLYVE